MNLIYHMRNVYLYLFSAIYVEDSFLTHIKQAYYSTYSTKTKYTAQKHGLSPCANILGRYKIMIWRV